MALSDVPPVLLMQRHCDCQGAVAIKNQGFR